MSMMPEAMIGPVAGPAPPTQQPSQLRDLFQQIDAKLWSDGGIDQQEMMDTRIFFETTMMKIAAQQRGERVGPGLGFGGMQPTAAPEPPPTLSGQQPPPTEEFGSYGGEPLEPNEQQQGTEPYRGGY
jgi:hypothetical protein